MLINWISFQFEQFDRLELSLQHNCWHLICLYLIVNCRMRTTEWMRSKWMQLWIYDEVWGKCSAKQRNQANSHNQNEMINFEKFVDYLLHLAKWLPHRKLDCGRTSKQTKKMGVNNNIWTRFWQIQIWND